MNTNTWKQKRSEAARRLILDVGGPFKLARLLSEKIGRTVKPNTVVKWQENGVPLLYTDHVAEIGSVTSEEVCPNPFKCNQQ